jgi:hypothetical protein
MLINLYLFFIIIGTLIVILGCIIPDDFFQRLKNIESFENPDTKRDNLLNQYKLSFPDIEEIKNKIASESYFQFFKEVDAKSRGLQFTFEDFQNKYKSSVMDFDEKEKTGIKAFYKDIVEIIPEKYRSNLLLPELKLAKVTGIENSYPHTHEDIVIFDKSYYSNFKNYNTLQDSKLNGLAKTLIHEIVHVKQRENPTQYDDLYRKWGFQSVSIQYLKENIPKHVFNRIRLNPDELPYYRFWVWKNTVMPLVIYSTLDVTQIDQVLYIGIDWNNKEKKKYINEWDDYINYFGIPNNNYHPIEILAEYQSMYFMELIGERSATAINPEGYKLYKKYFNL